MTDAMVHQTRQITPELITAASMLVRIAHPNDASLARALDKAATRLFELPWVVTDGLLQIASHSHPNDVNVTDGNECTCPTTRGVCYQRAAWMILSTISAAGINPVAPLPLPMVYDESDLPGDFLDSLGDELGANGFDDFELNMPFDELPVAPPAPFRIQPARTIEPEPGSAFARSQALADELFAA